MNQFRIELATTTITIYFFSHLLIKLHLLVGRFVTHLLKLKIRYLIDRPFLFHDFPFFLRSVKVSRFSNTTCTTSYIMIGRGGGGMYAATTLLQTLFWQRFICGWNFLYKFIQLLLYTFHPKSFLVLFKGKRRSARGIEWNHAAIYDERCEYGRNFGGFVWTLLNLSLSEIWYRVYIRYRQAHTENVAWAKAWKGARWSP